MRRREFIMLLGGGLVACPVCVGAQQPTTPVIGFLSSLTASDQAKVTTAFRQGLQEAGYVLGQNVAIEYRWAEGQYNRLPVLAEDLVRGGVAVIAAISGTPSGLAAKAITTTIPIVFAVGSDPIAEGLVTSLSRPTSNVTGVTFYTAQLGGPRLGLLRELVPNATKIAILMNPENAASVSDALGAEAAAQAIGQPTMRLNASTEGQIDDAFGVVAHQRISALFVSADPLYLNH